MSVELKPKQLETLEYLYDKRETFTAWPTGIRVRVMVFNATFNNISVISRRSVLFVEETRAPGEKH